MVTSANAQRLLCRIMLAAWLIAVGVMAVAALGGGASTGNLLALLFTGNSGGMPVMPPSAPAAPAPAPEPAPAPTPESDPVPEPAVLPAVAAEPSAWRDLPRGKRPGKGRLLPPRIEVRKDGSLLLLFGYEGTLGEHTTITPANVPSRSVDLHGQWASQITVDSRPQSGCVKRLQIASHPGWLRISAVGRDATPLAADVSYSDKDVRIIFHPLTH